MVTDIVVPMMNGKGSIVYTTVATDSEHLDSITKMANCRIKLIVKCGVKIFRQITFKKIMNRPTFNMYIINGFELTHHHCHPTL